MKSSGKKIASKSSSSSSSSARQIDVKSVQKELLRGDGVRLCCANCYYPNGSIVGLALDSWKIAKKQPIQIETVVGGGNIVARMMTPMTNIVNVYVKKEQVKNYAVNEKKSFKLYCTICDDVVGLTLLGWNDEVAIENMEILTNRLPSSKHTSCSWLLSNKHTSFRKGSFGLFNSVVGVCL